MKKIYTLIASFLLLANVTTAQIAANYQVGTWYGFKPAALTYSFDDNTSNQLSAAMPLFNKYNFKMSFNVVTSWVSDWTPYAAASNNGHEIASHTVTHINFQGVSASNQDPELKNSQATINSKITNTKCLTIIYPNCNIGDVATMSKYYISGRTCSGQINSSNITDYWNISSLICGDQGLNTAQALNDKANAAKSAKGWCVYLIHGIDGQGGFSPLQSSVLSSHLQYVNTNKADYWVATQINVVKYIKQRSAAKIVETAITSDSLKMVLTDGLDNSIYDATLSIRRAMPAGWAGAQVYLGSNKIASTTVSVNGTNYISFDAVPDKGDIFIANTASTVAAPAVISPIHYCLNTSASPLSATGTGLKWYTAQTGGTGSASAPVPATSAGGIFTFYVSQTVNAKESPRALITVNISDVPAAPAVVSPVKYTLGQTALPLAASGSSLNWYSSATGGTASPNAPTPATSSAATLSYYVSQSNENCESPRAKIDVVIAAAPIVKLQLHAGWNLVGCILDESTPIETALANIWPNVVGVKDADSFYLSTADPAFNLLKTVEWGRGYWVNLSADCELIWSAH